MARAHRGYLAYLNSRCHPRRRSCLPTVSRSSSRFSTMAAAAMPVAMLKVGPFLLRSIVLLRHRRRPGRYAHDYRVQSAPVGCPSRAGRLLVMLTTTHRSDCSTPDFDPQGPPFLVILSIFFCLTYQFAATRRL